MTKDEKISKCIAALGSLFQMLKTRLPNDIHQTYINEILEEIGEEKQK